MVAVIVSVCDRYSVPGSEREKLTEALKRIAPQAVELSSSDWWLHSQFMVSLHCLNHYSTAVVWKLGGHHCYVQKEPENIFIL